jgi:molecular chaperone DnaK (HSP70)
LCYHSFALFIENKFVANEDVVLMDVLPLSLGVELADGSYSIIVPKNTPLPVKRGQKYCMLIIQLGVLN